MESLETTACFRDDLLDFPSDISDDDDDRHHHHLLISPRLRVGHRDFSLLPCPNHLPSTFPEFAEEEELEWISNKDAFPMVESFADIMPNYPSISTSNDNISSSNNGLNGPHLSPVSVLENSSSSSTTTTTATATSGGMISAMISLSGIFKVPGKARSKQCRKRRKVLPSEQFICWEKVKPYRAVQSVKSSSTMGRKCLHCGAEKTPQWRAGPLGPKTLCNACGVRYKSGRLVPEYRPASSPTFSSELHSNSHRKVIEMRRQKLMSGELNEVKPGAHIGH